MSRITGFVWDASSPKVREGFLIYALASEHPVYPMYPGQGGHDRALLPHGPLVLVNMQKGGQFLPFGVEIPVEGGFDEMARYLSEAQVGSYRTPPWFAPWDVKLLHPRHERNREMEFMSATLRRFLAREIADTEHKYSHDKWSPAYSIAWNELPYTARMLLEQVHCSVDNARHCYRIRRRRLSKDWDVLNESEKYLVLDAAGLRGAVRPVLYDRLTPFEQILLLPELLNTHKRPVYGDIDPLAGRGKVYRFRVINPTLPLVGYTGGDGAGPSDRGGLEMGPGITVENPGTLGVFRSAKQSLARWMLLDDPRVKAFGRMVDRMERPTGLTPGMRATGTIIIKFTDKSGSESEFAPFDGETVGQFLERAATYIVMDDWRGPISATVSPYYNAPPMVFSCLGGESRQTSAPTPTPWLTFSDGPVVENPQHEHPLESLGECDVLKCRTCRRTFAKYDSEGDEEGERHAHPLHVAGRGELFWCATCRKAFLDTRPGRWDLWERVFEDRALGLH